MTTPDKHGWMPIESCDQTPCIVFANGFVGEANNRRLENHPYWKNIGEWWWANTDSEYSDSINPTHWQPLPQPPEE